MDLWEIVVVTIRRWKVTVPVLVGGLVVLLIMAAGVAPTWKAKSAIGFLGASGTLAAAADDPGQLIQESATNPLTGDSRNIARYAQTAAGSGPAQIALGQSGVASNYEVLLDNFYPVITIEAEASTPEAALETNAFLFSYVADNVDSWQTDAGLDETNPLRQQAFRLFSDEAATKDTTSRIKVLLIGGVALLLLVCGSGILADLIAYRRGQSRHPLVAAAAAGPAPGTTVPQEWIARPAPTPAAWNEV